jgi:hypothetical protein
MTATMHTKQTMTLNHEMVATQELEHAKIFPSALNKIQNMQMNQSFIHKTQVNP